VGVADHTPGHPDAHFDDFSSPHEGVVHFVMGDGHVIGIGTSISTEVYQAMATRAAGDYVPENFD
jgi:hypothetical protein